MAEPQCKPFLTGGADVGAKPLPCTYYRMQLARIALSSQASPTFAQGEAMQIPAGDFPTNATDLAVAGATVLSQYRYTLRLPNDGYVYVLEKANGPMAEFVIDAGKIIDESGVYEHIRVNTAVKLFWIAYSPLPWDAAVKKRFAASPDMRMTKIILKKGEDHPYVTSGTRIPELVEEFKKAPGHVMSIRGYSGAKNVCDSEEDYVTDVYPGDPEKRDSMIVQRRWNDGQSGKAFFWQPDIPENQYPDFLIALHDPIGIALEFASLHKASLETIGAYEYWYSYPDLIGTYVKSLQSARPDLAEHLLDRGTRIKEYKLGPVDFAVRNRKYPPDGASAEPLQEGETVHWMVRRDHKTRTRFWWEIRMKNMAPVTPQYRTRKLPETPIGKPFTLFSLEGASPPAWEHLFYGKKVRGTPYPRLVMDGKSRMAQWYVAPEEILSVRWKLGELDLHVAEQQKRGKILQQALSLLEDDRKRWLGAEGKNSFVSVLTKDCDNSNATKILIAREALYAASHKYLTADPGGLQAAQDLYLGGYELASLAPGKEPVYKAPPTGDRVSLFDQINAGKTGNKPLELDESSVTLVETFVAALPNMIIRKKAGEAYTRAELEASDAYKLQAKWLDRVPDSQKTSVRRMTVEDLIRQALNLMADLDTEHQGESRATGGATIDGSGRPVAPTNPAAEFMLHVLQNSEAHENILKTTVDVFGCTDAVYVAQRVPEATSAPGKLERVSDSARTVMKLVANALMPFNLARSTAEFMQKQTVHDFLEVIDDLGALVSLKSVHARLQTQFGKQWAQRINLLAKAAGANAFLAAANVVRTHYLFGKDDYDAGVVTAVSVGALFLPWSGTGVVLFLGLQALAALLTNDQEEEWLTHSYWGEYYRGTFRGDGLPDFSYRRHYLTERKAQEDLHPMPPEEAEKEKKAQQTSWLKMIATPKCLVKRGSTHAYVKFTAYAYDFLNSSFNGSIKLRHSYEHGKNYIIHDNPALTPVSFRPELIVKTLSGNDALQTTRAECIIGIQWETVIDIEAVRKKLSEDRWAERKSGHWSADTNNTSMDIDVTFNYLPNDKDFSFPPFKRPLNLLLNTVNTHQGQKSNVEKENQQFIDVFLAKIAEKNKARTASVAEQTF